MSDEIQVINKLVEKVKLDNNTSAESGIAMSPNTSVQTKVAEL